MGASVTTNVSKTVQNTVTRVSQKQLQSAIANTTQSNTMHIKTKGDINFDGGTINQSNAATVNLKQVARGMTDSTVQQQMQALLRQKAMSENKDFNIK